MNQKPEIPQNQSKRDFLQWILGGGVLAFLGAVLYPIFAYLNPPKQAEVEVSSVKAGKLSELEIESGKIIKFGTKPVLLIRTANNEVRAFSATCTHLDCTVQFRKDFGMIWCACHNGKYDLNGRNVSGPPPRPLDEFRVVVQGDEILISKKT
jgi:cytochrome b6-f complex iron-sulfur subunit